MLHVQRSYQGRAMPYEGAPPPVQLLYGQTEEKQDESLGAILLTMVGVPLLITLAVWWHDQSSPTKTAQRQRRRRQRRVARAR